MRYTMRPLAIFLFILAAYAITADAQDGNPTTKPTTKPVTTMKPTATTTKKPTKLTKKPSPTTKPTTKQTTAQTTTSITKATAKPTTESTTTTTTKSTTTTIEPTKTTTELTISTEQTTTTTEPTTTTAEPTTNTNEPTTTTPELTTSTTELTTTTTEPTTTTTEPTTTTAEPTKSGHGRLMDPSAVNAMWRFGFLNPVDYQDNELYSGGFAIHWSVNGGKCGVCGNRWDVPEPRLHKSGGFYDMGLLGRRYTPGQVIDVEVELTANHKGYFEIRLCPLSGDLTLAENQECFNKYPLYLDGQSTYRFQIPEETKRQETFNYRVKLPNGITCSRCVIQWIYVTGYTWDVRTNGTEAVRCGNQETFRNCADVAITTNTGGFGSSGVVPTTEPTTTNTEPTTTTIEPTTTTTTKSTTIPIASTTTTTKPAATKSYCKIQTCPIPTENTLCKYTNTTWGTQCQAPYPDASTVGAADIMTILTAHNDFRRKVAKGQEARGNPGPQPPASNMRKLIWDKELAVMAQTHAQQCVFDHDTCRDVVRFQVGQNIYVTGSSASNSTSFWPLAVKAWYDEGASMTKTYIDSSPARPLKIVGHYTQLVWATFSTVGCGVAYYQSTAPFGAAKPYVKLYVCNYGPAGNFFGSPIYARGLAGSACPVSTKNDDGLCA